MKKLFTIILAVMLLFSLSACGGEETKKTVKSEKSDKVRIEEIKPEKENKTVERVPLDESASPEAKKIYAGLSEIPMHIDDIVRKTNLKMNEVLSCVTELELFGYVEAMSGKKYKIK